MTETESEECQCEVYPTEFLALSCEELCRPCQRAEERAADRWSGRAK